MPAPIRKTTLPAFSALHGRIKPGDFVDCYRVSSPLPPRVAADIVTAFPWWARGLLHLRRWLTTPFGIDNDGPQVPDRVGIFPVEHNTPTELIAGFDDIHLDFRVSVMSDNGHVLLATWVHPHHIGGWIYLWAIMPFHILIVRNALARIRAHPMAGQTV